MAIHLRRQTQPDVDQAHFEAVVGFDPDYASDCPVCQSVAVAATGAAGNTESE